MTLNLGNKILLAAAGAVVITTLAAVVTVHELSTRNRVQSLQDDMRCILRQSETVAEDMDKMYSNHAFDTAGLLKRAKEQSGGKPLREIYDTTGFYDTIPIVAAWQAVKRDAKDSGYSFYTPSKPGVAARNPKNDNGSEFSDAFKAFDRGEKEYFFQDKDKKQLVLAHPVVLRESCLACHGDPAKSPTGDGQDALGFQMENLKAGDIKGAFVLVAPMTHDAVIASTLRTMLSVGAAVLVMVLIGFFQLNRRLVLAPLNNAIQSLGTASGEVSGAAGQISGSSQTLAEGASEQAASLEETSASLEEISSMTRRNAQTAQSAKEFTAQTRQTAEAGAQGTREMSQAMEGIRSASHEMRDAMNGIKAASADVSKIIKTIDEIAFQTNILALNAAVEAARAGEAGMGFAVVADEVRNLAQRSAKAARETTDMIEASIKRSDDGVRVTEKVTAAIGEVAAKSRQVEQHLDQILQKARQVDEQVAEIASASTEQSQGISQVNTAVNQMDKVTQGNAASAEESAAAAEELNAQAAVLKDAVSELQQLVGGGTPSAPRPAAASRASGTTKPSLARKMPAPKTAFSTPNQRNSPAAIPMPSAPAMQSPAIVGLPESGDFRDF